MTDDRKTIRVYRAGRVVPLFALLVFLAFPAYGQSAGAPVITMTFTGEVFRFSVAGSGEAVVDWGDGGRETITLKEENFVEMDFIRGVDVTHIYNVRPSAVNVTIEGNVTDLFCSHNDITTIDVSGNPGLVYLNCGDTGITTLDVSGNPALKSLSCGDTGITALDVSKNPALLVLNCARTGITTLDLRGNPGLEGLRCAGTGITSLDLRKNPALLTLSCGDTGITSLDLRDKHSLEVLDCSDTGITSLDLRGNPALMNLTCYNTRITSLDVRGNPALWYLSLYNTAINAAAVEALFASLPDRRGESEAGYIHCGGDMECGEEAHAVARAKNWEVEHW